VNSLVEIPTALLINYLLLLARVAGLIGFAPIPGFRQIPAQPKIVLALGLTALFAPAALAGAGPDILASPAFVWTLAGMLAAEAAFGIAIGAVLSLLLEAFGLAAQILGFQAGYSYINMVDPTTQVDASVINVLLTLLGGLLFFGFNLHLHLVRAVYLSLERWPLGALTVQPGGAMAVVEFGGQVFETAVRLAFPVVAVLLLIDLTLGLLNQINSRLQLLTLAFPAKIVASAALLYPVLLVAPRLFNNLAGQAFELITLLVAR
jgi:flagellar biosynthetic protein FliR